MTSRNAAALPARVSPYGRISDTDEERAPGIDRQLRIVHPLIESNSYAATRDYIDNNYSAFDPEVYRPDFEQWLADFEADLTDGIAAYHIDRVTRQNAQLERIIAAYVKRYKLTNRKGVFLFPSGSIDLTNSDGQMYARLLVMMANKSSSDTVRRISDFYRDEALKGRVYSNHPAFYRNANGTINEERAALTRQAIVDVLDNGLRPNAIATTWRRQGITTAYGGDIEGETVRRILTSPGIAGLSVYQGQTLLAEDGTLIKRVDGGITDEDTWRRLCEKLKTTPGRRERTTKALLSPFLRCGSCGGSMGRRQRVRPSGKVWFSYECDALDKQCKHKVGISGPKLDAQVTALVLDYLNDPVEVEDKPFSGQARIERVTADIAALMAQLTSGELDGSIVIPSVKKLQDELRTLRLAAVKHERAKVKVTTPADEWPTLDLERRQAIVGMIFEAIVIMPATKGRGKAYDPDRVKPVYREIDRAELLARLSVLLAA